MAANPPTDAAQPLAGVRVVDLTTFLSGPAAVRTFAELGADVIRVEPPQGDPTRAGGGRPGEAPSDFYLALHRDRRGVALDLKCDAGRSVLRDLVARSDVLIENFRPGVTARLGVSYDDLATLNPALVYCTISGYGPDGPVADHAATDGALQAFGGVLELTGTGGELGLPVPLPIADLVAGAVAAQGALAALVARARTGRGAHVEVSMLESLLSWLLVADRERTLAPPTTLVVVASDGVAILVQSVLHFHSRLMEVLSAVPGCESLAHDPRFATREDRTAHRDAYETLVRRAFVTRSSREWLDTLGTLGIPASPVHRIDEALDHPQLRHRGATTTLDVAGLGVRSVLAPPVSFDGGRKMATTAPPAIGEHTVDVLRTELGYSTEQIARLRAAGAFGDAEP